MAFLRTTLLLGLLTGILLTIGYLFAGIGGMTVAFIFALLINFLSYWFSDSIVLRIYNAKPTDNKKLNSIVENLSDNAGIPKPRVYIINTDNPNAFATGRSASHSAIAATTGLLNKLEYDEIEAVLAHEVSHIKNRDVLVSTMAATIGGAISYLAQIAWYSSFGDRNSRGNMVLLPFVLLAPFAAMLVRFAISRGREFGADYTGAYLSKKPLKLASALEKISNDVKAHPIRGNAATSHLWIVNPFRGDGLVNLFSTHPPINERIERLKRLSTQIK